MKRHKQAKRCKMKGKSIGAIRQRLWIMYHSSTIENERGIALAMVLILSAIVLAIIAGLIFMITSTTQITGMQKRYKTALEAGLGGAELTYQFIALRGDQNSTNWLTNDLSSLSPSITTPAGCTGTDISNVVYTGLEAKLRTPTTTWSGCDNTLSIIPGTLTSYDMKFDLGMRPKYTIYAKIVDTVEGNSGSDEGLLKHGVVSSGSGEITVMKIPYLYTIAIDAEDFGNPSERAKLSILYQY